MTTPKSTLVEPEKVILGRLKFSISVLGAFQIYQGVPYLH
jgi:hypothetical protein